MAEQSFPPNKRIRLDAADPAPAEESSEEEEKPLLTQLSDDIVIFLCTFLSYQRGVMALDGSCKQFHKIIKENQTSCIHHFEFGTREFSYSSNHLFSHLKKVLELGSNAEAYDDWFHHFFDRFANLQSLQLLTLDQTFMNSEDAAAIKPYVKYLLKPLASRLTALTVDTWEDGALFAHSFNFENICFPNVRSLTINGKDAKYPFHVVSKTPHVRKLVIKGCNMMVYSVIRMFLDTQHSPPQLADLQVCGCIPVSE